MERLHAYSGMKNDIGRVPSVNTQEEIRKGNNNSRHDQLTYYLGTVDKNEQGVTKWKEVNGPL
jgi:hypothetical protein